MLITINLDEEIAAIENRLHELKEFLMVTKTADLPGILAGITTHLEKVGAETTASLDKIKDLQDKLEAAGTLTPEVESALNALQTQLQKVDDMIDDAPTGAPAPAPASAPAPAPAPDSGSGTGDGTGSGTGDGTAPTGSTNTDNAGGLTGASEGSTKAI